MDSLNSGEQYNLKWNLHVSNFIQTFIEHLHEESLVDVSLFCEGQYIKTHKLILSACSEYFRKIFKVVKDVTHPVILLNGVRFHILKHILHFMYHGEVKVADTDLPDVLALGETLQIKGLSSVKLRDMPLEEVNIINPTAQTAKNLDKPEPDSNKVRKETTSIRSLSSDIPKFVPIVPSFTYSKRKSLQKRTPVEASISLPVISSVISEASSSATVVPEGAPRRSTSINGKPKSTTINEDPKSSASKPPHAFMIFANEWRKKLTVEHPEENNKEISVRLGNMWKNLLPETKNIYYREAKRAEAEHKFKHPNYLSAADSLKRKADVLSDTTNNISGTASVDPMEIVEIQEEIPISDSD